MRVALASLVLLTGCYESVSPPIDVGPYDGGPCAPVGGFEVCTDECGGAGVCNEGLYCNDVVCVDFLDVCDAPLAPFDENDTAFGAFCERGGSACLRDPRARGSRTGACVPDTSCSGLDGLGLECFWWDTSAYDGSPPPSTEVCPPSGTPLCGGSCGDCPEDNDAWSFHCLGRNGSRDVGVCTHLSGGCSRELSASRFFTTAPDEAWSFTGMACLVFLDESGAYPAWGHPVPDTGCRAYRELFPEAVECLDDSWTPLP